MIFVIVLRLGHPKIKFTLPLGIPARKVRIKYMIQLYLLNKGKHDFFFISTFLVFDFFNVKYCTTAVISNAC